jgi:hypothetical protein
MGGRSAGAESFFIVEQDVRASVAAARIKYGSFFMGLLSVCLLLLLAEKMADSGA